MTVKTPAELKTLYESISFDLQTTYTGPLGQENAVSVDARCDERAGHAFHASPSEVAVVYEFAPFIAGRYAPLSAPFHVCHVVVCPGDCCAQFVVLFPLVVIFAVVVAIPLLVFKCVFCFWLNLAVCIEIASFPRVCRADGV